MGEGRVQSFPYLIFSHLPSKRGFSRKLKAQSWRCMIFTVVVSALIFLRVPPIQKGYER